MSFNPPEKSQKNPKKSKKSQQNPTAKNPKTKKKPKKAKKIQKKPKNQKPKNPYKISRLAKSKLSTGTASKRRRERVNIRSGMAEKSGSRTDSSRFCEPVRLLVLGEFGDEGWLMEARQKGPMGRREGRGPMGERRGARGTDGGEERGGRGR
jgi:hypothetical protein